MQEKFKFNPRKCSFASTLSGAFQIDMPKVIISFPTNADIIELMEKTLIGRMCIVNTRVGFHSNIFIKRKQQNWSINLKTKQQME